MTIELLRVRRSVMPAILAVACGYLWGCGARSEMLDRPENELPTLPGTGGLPATGGAGAGGTSATGGAGGGFLGSCEYPACLWSLIRDCLVEGPCSQQDSLLADGATQVTELCCSNGVDELVTVRTQGSRITATVAVTKKGNKCYDVQVSTRADGSAIDYVWLDPGGRVVAKASMVMTSSSLPAVYCTNGESMTMTEDCAPDGSQEAEVRTGTCP